MVNQILPLLTAKPGQSQQFKFRPIPFGAGTTIGDIGWAVESSDNSNVSMVSTSSDIYGMTATLTIPSTTLPGSVITFWCVYRNNAGTGPEITGGPWAYIVA